MTQAYQSIQRLLVAVLWFINAHVSFADESKPSTEADFYELATYTIPQNVVLEVGAIDQLPNGWLAVASRRGDIYLVENAEVANVGEAKFHLYARGLHEVLGLDYRDGWLYATQRGELSRLKDTNNDHQADVFETVNDEWEISGDYHEYAFGSKFDADGSIWITLCLTGSFGSDVKYRGWCVRITPDGKMLPTCSGIRSPGGIGANAAGDMFYTDNQGPWNGTCGLKFLRPGSFQGHPGGNRWYAITDAIGRQPKDPMTESRMMTEAEKIPALMPTAVYFPYTKMGKSAAGIECDRSNGLFGPFSDQLFVTDQSASTVMRVFLEKINGRYQGACFPFRKGFASGSLAVFFTANHSLIVGGTNRGWGSVGTKPFALERLRWTGRMPFEIKEMRAKPDGFELTFTKPVDRQSASNPESYDLQTYTYIYQHNYGSPEVDHTRPPITDIKVADDGLSVRLTIDGLQIGHVHELKCRGVRSADSRHPLLHDEAYYTLNYLPNN